MTDLADVFVHPLSGELLRGGKRPTLVDLNAAVDDTWTEIDRLKTAVGPLMERRAELRGPVSRPRRRYQTETQTRLCPSCARTWTPEEAA